MADDQEVGLEAAAANWRRAQESAERARAAADEAAAEVERLRLVLVDAVVAEARAGTRQKDIIDRTGLARETVRRYLRAHGIEA